MKDDFDILVDTLKEKEVLDYPRLKFKHQVPKIYNLVPYFSKKVTLKYQLPQGKLAIDIKQILNGTFRTEEEGDGSIIFVSSHVYLIDCYLNGSRIIKREENKDITDVIPFIKTIPGRVEKELDKQKENRDNERVRLRKLQDILEEQAEEA